MIWATLIALPTSTPDNSNGGTETGSPCVFTGNQIACNDSSGRSWNLPINERIGCPINETLRQPYPRGLVTEPNNLLILPNEWYPSPGGQWGAPQDPYSLMGLVNGAGEPLQANLVRQVQFGLRSQRLSKDTNWRGMIVPDIKWTFQGVSSAGDPGVQYGISSTFHYNAASYVGPRIATGAVANKGRRFDFGARLPSNTYDLPAYPVTIETYCGFWFSLRMEVSSPYWQRLSDCFPTWRDTNGDLVIPAGFSTEGCPTDQIAFGETRYQWVPWTWIPWTGYDMRLQGLPTSYVPSRRATGGGIFKNVRYSEPAGNGIWVPVVEVQTVQQED